MFSLPMMRLRRYRVVLILAAVMVVLIYKLGDSQYSEVLSEYNDKYNPLHDLGSIAAYAKKGKSAGDEALARPGATAGQAEQDSRWKDDGSNTLKLPDREPLPRPDDAAQGVQSMPTGDSEAYPIEPKPEPIYWEKQKEHFPVSARLKTPRGKPKPLPKIQHNFAINPETKEQEKIRLERRAHVKSQMTLAWSGYREYAWLHDEILPVSGGYRDPFAGWGATLVDSLDTLWIMDMRNEFEEGVKALSKIDFKTATRNDIPIFETTIRYLGGLMGAYDISNEKYPALRDKAKELGELLLSAFDTPNRMPVLYYHWKPAFAANPHRASYRSNIAELGSLSLEFTRLAQMTKDDRYYDVIARITDALYEWSEKGTPLDGIFPKTVDASGCNRSASPADSMLTAGSGYQSPMLDTVKEPPKRGSNGGKADELALEISENDFGPSTARLSVLPDIRDAKKAQKRAENNENPRLTKRRTYEVPEGEWTFRTDLPTIPKHKDIKTPYDIPFFGWHTLNLARRYQDTMAWLQHSVLRLQDVVNLIKTNEVGRDHVMDSMGARHGPLQQLASIINEQHPGHFTQDSYNHPPEFPGIATRALNGIEEADVVRSEDVTATTPRPRDMEGQNKVARRAVFTDEQIKSFQEAQASKPTTIQLAEDYLTKFPKDDHLGDEDVELQFAATVKHLGREGWEKTVAEHPEFVADPDSQFQGSLGALASDDQRLWDATRATIASRAWSDQVQQNPGFKSPRSDVMSSIKLANGTVIIENEDWDCVPQGLAPAAASPNDRETYSMGGGQDSTYEYFTKMHLLLGGLEPKYEKLYKTTMAAVKKHLLYRPMIPEEDRAILFSGEVEFGDVDAATGLRKKTFDPKISHLTCFLGGMVGLGSRVFANAEELELAKSLTDGCVWAYEATESGLMPEHARAIPCESVASCPWNQTLWEHHMDPLWAQREQMIKDYDDGKLKLTAQQQADAIAEEKLLLAAEQRQTQEAAEKIEREKKRVEMAAQRKAAAKLAEEEKALQEDLARQRTGTAVGLQDGITKNLEEKTKEVTEQKKSFAKDRNKLVKEMADTKKLIDKLSNTKKPKLLSKRAEGTAPVEETAKGVTHDFRDDASAAKQAAAQAAAIQAQMKPAANQAGSSEQKNPIDVLKQKDVVDPDSKDGKLLAKLAETEAELDGGEKGTGSVPGALWEGREDPSRPLTHEQYLMRKKLLDNIPEGYADIGSPNYILRPEAIESVFYMHRLTGDPQWADKGWEMFKAIVAATSTTHGHSAVGPVTLAHPEKLDFAESFWFAETLKYFYLLFSEPGFVSLDDWILTTEAHPFKRPMVAVEFGF